MLPTGPRMRLSSASKFATEVFISECNVDWGSEAIFAKHLDRAGVVLDIGANIGYYSLYVLPCVSGVHAFEPDPIARARLRQNLADHAKAQIHDSAVGLRSGRANFIIEENSEVSHLAGPRAESGKRICEISMTTIDDFVTEEKLSITGIKIDVEGADLEVIEGGLGTIGSQFPLVLTETRPENRLFDLVRPFGFRVFAFVKYPHAVRFGFREILEESGFQTKMLFLVPPRLHPVFEGLIEQD